MWPRPSLSWRCASLEGDRGALLARLAGGVAHAVHLHAVLVQQRDDASVVGKLVRRLHVDLERAASRDGPRQRHPMLLLVQERPAAQVYRTGEGVEDRDGLVLWGRPNRIDHRCYDAHLVVWIVARAGRVAAAR